MNIANLVSDVLVEFGESGNDIINAAFNDHNKMSFWEFIGACSGCNGDWVEIVISGIDKLFPKSIQLFRRIWDQTHWKN